MDVGQLQLVLRGFQAVWNDDARWTLVRTSQALR